MHDDEADGTALAPAPGRLLHADPHDFAGLYIRHRASFTLHARHYLRDPRDADDVVQEAFLRLFLALPELETELQALAYCRRTITNLCIDRYRAQARRPHLVDLASVPLEELADDEPADPVVRAEDAALVREALSMLSPLHRAALVKREIEEKPLPVIAEELAVPEESVKHLLFRARRALRRLLAGTSLAPGSSTAGSEALRAGSRALAGLGLLLALGLASGPDLEALPVVGVDLPDLLGVSDLAESVGDAVTDVVGVVTRAADQGSAPEPGSGSGPAGADAGGPESASDAAPLLGAEPSPVPSSPLPTVSPPVGAAAPESTVTGTSPDSAAPAVAPSAPVPQEPVPTVPLPATPPGAPQEPTAPSPAPAPPATPAPDVSVPGSDGTGSDGAGSDGTGSDGAAPDVISPPADGAPDEAPSPDAPASPAPLEPEPTPTEPVTPALPPDATAVPEPLPSRMLDGAGSGAGRLVETASPAPTDGSAPTDGADLAP